MGIFDSNNPQIPEWLKQPTTPPHSVPSDALQRSVQAEPTFSYQTQTHEKSPILKLQDCAVSGRKLLATNKAAKISVVQWIRRVRFALFSIFGKDATIVKDLDAVLKEAQSNGLSGQLFAQRLAEVEAALDYLNRLGGYPLAYPVSRVSRAPSTKDVFIIHGHDELNTRRLFQLLQGHFGPSSTVRSRSG